MKLVTGVFEIAESFMKNPEHVQMNYEGIERLGNKMLEAEVTKFPPQLPTTDKTKAILMEFVGDAINYCYWYGRSTIRPGGASSTLMYKLVEEAFENWAPSGTSDVCFYKLIELLALNRFPMLEEREKHIKELIGQNAYMFALQVSEGKHFDDMFTRLVKTFPGYASDIFLKRASLFFIQLYRKLGLFEEAMYKIHVPADYQVPKLLEHHRCIQYDAYLVTLIDSNMLIAKHSVLECEIRAATVLACKKLMEITKWNIADVDGWLWLRRNEVTTPFHLTITTDY